MSPRTHPRIRPVHQERSRKTLNAFLDALDRLLRDRPFESITVLELANTAKMSTGAFYARFASKEDLLPELYARFQDSLDELSGRELDPSQWAPLSADERIQRLTDFLCDTYEKRSWLLRAVAVHSRRRYPPDASADVASTAQAKWFRKIADCVCVAPSPWEDTARDELELAIYTMITLARESILFPHLPMAASLGLNAVSIRRRLPRLIRKLLGA